VLAVQGPHARAIVEGVWPEVAGVGRFKVARCAWRDTECVVAGTGYTGEPGIEVAIDAEWASELWDALVEAGVTPAGLGARDTLRLEAGLPLHGHELGPGITPLQAGLAWVVAFDKPAFRGRQALLDERQQGVARTIVGIATEGRRPPRSECPVLSDGRQVGVVTSGNFSPVLGHGIALALIEPGVGGAVVVDVRGSQLAGVVVETPFVRR
jgi:aminomethyltransferase